MDILIIGGTRNLGHLLVWALIEAGHHVRVFNRGQTPDELPPEVTRLHGDRSDPAQLAQALGSRSFDAVIDTTLYNGIDARVIAELLNGRVGHYMCLSTGQVYLVRRGLQRPFAEEQYAGPLTDAPAPGTRDSEEWLYGVEKRHAEDTLAHAWDTRRFPYTCLRLPMVNSERDHFHRIYNYLLRLKDGGPILIPTGTHLPLRHIYGHDVVQAIMTLLQKGPGTGRAYNMAQDQTVSLEDFLALLARCAGSALRIAPIEQPLLDRHQVFPDCSPFSDPWMSELDNRRSKTELGMQYTPVPVYVQRLIAHYEAHPPPTPEGYRRRSEEITLARQGAADGYERP